MCRIWIDSLPILFFFFLWLLGMNFLIRWLFLPKMFDRKEEIKIERNFLSFLSLYFYPFVPYNFRQNTPPPQKKKTRQQQILCKSMAYLSVIGSHHSNPYSLLEQNLPHFSQSVVVARCVELLLFNLWLLRNFCWTKKEEFTHVFL